MIRIFAIILFLGPFFNTLAQKPFGSGEAVTMVQNEDLIETSGIVASHNFPGYLWAHNDSGDMPRLFLFNAETGEVRSQVFLKGIRNRDWEDMAIGPGPDGRITLFIGEIGDNRRVYDSKGIYYFPEPAELSAVDTITDFSVYTFNFPDENRDSETLMVDPETRSLILMSKWEPRVRMYRIVWDQSAGTYGEISEIGKAGLTMITGGEISPDGNEMLLKSYESVFYLKKTEGKSWEEVLNEEVPMNQPYKQEKQGEAICWKLDGSGYYTMSEGRPVLIFYPRS